MNKREVVEKFGFVVETLNKQQKQIIQNLNWYKTIHPSRFLIHFMQLIVRSDDHSIALPGTEAAAGGIQICWIGRLYPRICWSFVP